MHVERNLIGESFIPFTLSPRYASIFEEMLSDFGLSDGANTSRRQYSDGILSPHIDCYVKQSFIDLQKLRKHLVAINRPGFLINCLKVHKENAAPGFLKIVRFDGEEYVCYGEDNVKDAEDLLAHFKQMKLYMDSDNLITGFSIIFSQNPVNNIELFWEKVDQIISLQTSTKKIMKKISIHISTGVISRNTIFFNHYKPLFTGRD